MSLHIDGRVMNFHGDLGELARKYSDAFVSYTIHPDSPLPGETLPTERFQLAQGYGSDMAVVFLYRLSPEKMRMFPNQKGNTEFYVIGTNQRYVSRLAREIKKAFGLEMKPLPASSKQTFQRELEKASRGQTWTGKITFNR